MRSIPSELLQKLHSNIQTKGKNAQPKMEVAIARAKTTVTDSSYWTVEKIREKEGLGDIAVAARRFYKHYGRPDRLYEIHVDNGEVKTALREYPDLAKAGWQDQFSLGAGTDVAIAFDGDWELYRKVWRLRTHEEPWIFWVDSLGDLYAQLWNDETTKVLLASGVSKVTAIRGWKELNQGLNDQGLVVTYVKIGGTVAYRNYCIQSDLTYIWEVERQITGFTGTAMDVGLFLTNDYRLGILVGNTLGNVWWLVTNRMWAGMSIPPEKLSASVTDLSFEVIQIQYYETQSTEYLSTNLTFEKFYVCPANIVPNVMSTERLDLPDLKTINIVFNYPLECDLINLKDNLTVQNKSSQNYTISEVLQNGSVLTLKTVEEMPESQDIIISYTAIGSYYLAFRVSPSCLYDYERVLSLEVEGVPPIGYTDESIKANVTDINFSVITVLYLRGLEIEQITSSITDISFVVTKVGNNPL